MFILVVDCAEDYSKSSDVIYFTTNFVIETGFDDDVAAHQHNSLI